MRFSEGTPVRRQDYLHLFDDDTVKTAFNTTDFPQISLAFFPPPFTFVLPNGLQAVLPDKRQIGVRASYSF